MNDTRAVDRDWRRAKELLRHVYWIGGSAAAGKSTISRRLTEEFGFTLFSGDGRWIRHWQTATEETNPIAHRIGLTLQRGDPFDWLYDRDGQQIADDYIRMAHVEFQESVDELLRMPRETPIVVDAFLGFPQLVMKVAQPKNAVFLVCTDDFMKKKWASRTTAGSPDLLPILKRQLDSCADPQAALQNFIDSNIIESRFVADDCRKSGAALIVTGGRIGVDEAYDAVKRHFGLGLRSTYRTAP